MENRLETTTTLSKVGENIDIIITYTGEDRPLSGQGYLLTKELEPIAIKGRTGTLLAKREDTTLVLEETFEAGWESNWSTSNDLLLDDLVIFTEIENGLRVECTGEGDSNLFYLFLSENEYLQNLFLNQSSGEVIIRVSGKFITTEENRHFDILVCRPTESEPYSFKVEGLVQQVYTSRGIEKIISESLLRELTGTSYGEFSGSTVAIRFRLNVPLIFEIYSIKMNTYE